MSQEISIVQQTQHQLATINQPHEIVINPHTAAYGVITLGDVLESANITAEQKSIIVSAYTEKKICEYDDSDEEEKKAIIGFINKSILRFGNNLNKDDTEQLLRICLEDIIAMYGMNTISDIGRALENGARKINSTKENTFYMFSVNLMHKWIREYNEEVRAEAIKKSNEVRGKETPKTKEEKMKITKDWLIKVFDELEKYRKTKLYNSDWCGSLVYDIAKKTGTITMNSELRNEIWQKAIEIVRRNHQPDKARGMGQRVEFSKIINNLIGNPKDEATLSLVVVESKSLSVPTVFDCWINAKETVDSILAKLPANYYN